MLSQSVRRAAKFGFDPLTCAEGAAILFDLILQLGALVPWRQEELLGERQEPAFGETSVGITCKRSKSIRKHKSRSKSISKSRSESRSESESTSNVKSRSKKQNSTIKLKKARER